MDKPLSPKEFNQLIRSLKSAAETSITIQKFAELAEHFDAKITETKKTVEKEASEIRTVVAALRTDIEAIKLYLTKMV